MFPIAFHPIYQHPLPEGHRFPMLKYELLPQQLLLEGVVTIADFFEPAICNLEHVLAVHKQEYVDDLLNLTLNPKAARKIGFPLSKELVQRELIIAQGTITGAQKSFETKISFNIAGGTHHAFSTHGEAFCLLNDQAIAAQFLLDNKLARKILIIDLDVHQGNGTASLFANEKRVFTFSMHGAHNYPFIKEKSDLDVPLPDGIKDDAYLELLTTNLSYIDDNIKPDFIFYLSGVDVLATDKFGKLKLTLKGCQKRDEMVFDYCYENKLPCVVSMGGGYSPDIRDIVEAHCNTFRVVIKHWG